uniref:Uncharacterized protein n=1 Tax=Anguilla anguilla TaxID=7936 RepID=A0A0E9QES4_ANGAN
MSLTNRTTKGLPRRLSSCRCTRLRISRGR